MEIFELFSFLDVIVTVLVIVSGFAATRFWSSGKPSMAWKTVIVSAVFVAVYTLIAYFTEQITEAYYSKCFVSYTVATSLYELILKQFKKKING
jgi:hypothetical protein